MGESVPAADSWHPLPKGIHGVVTSAYGPAPALYLGLSTEDLTVASQSAVEPPLTDYRVRLELGDTVHLLEECGSWYRGYVFPTLSMESGSKLGIFPASHIYSRSLQDRGLANSNRVSACLPEPLPAPQPEIELGKDTIPRRPSLSRTLTAPLPLSSALPSIELLLSESSPSPSPKRPSQPQRPLSYTAGYSTSPRRVAHPIPAPVRTNHETLTGLKEPLIDEIAAVLRDWGGKLKSYLELQEYERFQRVHGMFNVLFQGRRTLLAQTLAQEELVRLRRTLIATMEEGNMYQNMDLLVRHSEKGHLLSERNTTIINVYRMHLQLAERRRLGRDGLRSKGPTSPSSTIGNYIESPLTNTDLDVLATKFAHLLVEVRSCDASMCLPGEYAEIRFSLYNSSDGRMVTEEFIMKVDCTGKPVSDGAWASNKSRALFAELAFRDLTDSMYLVCRLIRVGKMNVSEKESEKADRAGYGSVSSLHTSTSSLDIANGNPQNSPHYRRPFGWAVALVGDLLKPAEAGNADVEKMKEIRMRIYVPSSESQFTSICENIINRSGGYETSSRADSLHVTLRVFRGDLKAVTRTYPALLPQATVTPRNGFYDVILPGVVRNSMYLTLVSGEFIQSRKPSIRNIQVTVQVRLTNGNPVEECISCGAGEGKRTYYDSIVFYHNTTPKWTETIRIDLPTELFEKAHVFFTFRHCSSSDKGDGKDRGERNFAFAFLPLLRGNHMVISDSTHSLNLYKYDKRVAVSSVYLTYPAGANLLVPAKQAPSSFDALTTAADAMSKLPMLKDSVTIRTQLCSTKLTQNVSLHNFLHWRQGHQPVKTVLREFILIGELEIIMFLPAILDSLFSILDAVADGSLGVSSQSVDDLVFSALVFILGIVVDKRFTSHRAALDNYIRSTFSSERAWEILLRGFERLIKHPQDSGKGKELRSAIKVWSYLLRFAIRSNVISTIKGRKAHSQISGEIANNQGDLVSSGRVAAPTSEFIQSITSLFNAINQMMTLSSPEHIIGSQTLTLQHFASLLPDLVQVFPPPHLVNIAATFVDSVRSNRAKLNGYKLLFVKELVKGFLFADDRSRGVVVNCVCRWVGEWIREWLSYAPRTFDDIPPTLDLAKDSKISGERENLKFCLDVVAEVVDRLQRLMEKREREKDKVKGVHEHERVADGTSTESEATLMCVADLLPKLLDVHLTLVSELGGSAGGDERYEHRRRADTGVKGMNTEKQILPQSLELAQLDAIILAIVHLLREDQMQSFLVKQGAGSGPRGTVRFLYTLCEVFGHMIGEQSFPISWVSMNMIAHRVTTKVLRPVSELMRAEFVGGKDEDNGSTGKRASVAFSISGSELSNAEIRSGARTFYTAATAYGTAVNGEHSAILDESGTQAWLHRIWDGYFRVLLQLLNSRWLQIERFEPQQARAAHKLSADVRGEGGEVLRTMWEYLGSTSRGKTLQAGFIPTLVGPFLQLTASPHPVLRSAAVELLFNTIEPEFEQVGHFGRVEVECIERLHRLIAQERLGDDAYRSFIVDALERRFATRALLTGDEDDHSRELTTQGQAFIGSLDKFLGLSLRIRDLPLGEQSHDEAVETVVKMLRFLRSIGRRNIYVEYVHRLFDFHMETNDVVEAALALKLHGDLLEWRSDALLEPLPAYGFTDWQTEFERKEAIYLRCVELLETGQTWERALELCRELAGEYERKAYSFSKLANILRRQADLCAGIAATSRCQPEYYRVGFYGRDCPPLLRNKQFIYRGGEWEKLGSFCERILRKHVGGKLAKSNAYPPPPEVKDGDGLWLQVTGVKPIIDWRAWRTGKDSGAFGAIQWERPSSTLDNRYGFNVDGVDDTDLLLIEPDLSPYSATQRASAVGGNILGALERADERVKSYYEANEVNVFAFSRPVRKSLPAESTLSASDVAREFLELWTEKTVFLTDDRFPGLSRQCEVVRVESYELSPVENAIIAVRGKNKQLQELEKKFAPFAQLGLPRPSSDLGARGSYLPVQRPGRASSSSAAEIPNVNPFTMALNGAVDAPVNGGIPMYKRAFLSTEYRSEAEKNGREMLVNMLERAIEEQVEIIHRCLMVHDHIVPEQMRPLHEELITFFHKNFADDIARLNLPPLRPGRQSGLGGRRSESVSPTVTSSGSSASGDLRTNTTANTAATTTTTSRMSSSQRSSVILGLRHSASTASSRSSIAKRGL
ncbi:hypothetical protein SpCBS45565_g07576 [Spizellomyces sp. 'palustris']|nr:hypothetical protein SpCBS45565_g07576 [Spizellomyces sp. 'palustris']